jgi:hypothetical protein
VNDRGKKGSFWDHTARKIRIIKSTDDVSWLSKVTDWKKTTHPVSYLIYIGCRGDVKCEYAQGCSDYHVNREEQTTEDGQPGLDNISKCVGWTKSLISDISATLLLCLIFISYLRLGFIHLDFPTKNLNVFLITPVSAAVRPMSCSLDPIKKKRQSV